MDPNFRVRSSASHQGVVFGSSKPFTKPRNPEFSSGPCKKRPGYNLAGLKIDSLGEPPKNINDIIMTILMMTNIYETLRKIMI